MAVYVIVEVDIHDAMEYENYKKLTPGSIAAYDGRFLVRGGQATNLEGDWEAARIVLLEFPTAERANEWWNSEEYAVAKSIRQRTATTRMILVEGVPPVSAGI